MGEEDQAVRSWWSSSGREEEEEEREGEKRKEKRFRLVPTRPHWRGRLILATETSSYTSNVTRCFCHICDRLLIAVCCSLFSSSPHAADHTAIPHRYTYSSTPPFTTPLLIEKTAHALARLLKLSINHVSSPTNHQSINTTDDQTWLFKVPGLLLLGK